jgi:hypothetical protein
MLHVCIEHDGSIATRGVEPGGGGHLFASIFAISGFI